jgi:hypothetical protein
VKAQKETDHYEYLDVGGRIAGHSGRAVYGIKCQHRHTHTDRNVISKMDLREIRWGGVDWINVDQDQWTALVNKVMNEEYLLLGYDAV